MTGRRSSVAHEPDPTAVAFVLECNDAGMSVRDIVREVQAADYPITRATVHRWIKRYGPEGGKPLPGSAAAPQAAPEPPPKASPKPDVSGIAGALAARREEPPPPPEPTLDIPEGGSEGATLDTLRNLLRITLKEVAANRVKNPKLSQQLGRDAAAMANTIARLEKGVGDDADVIRISREEVDATSRKLRERIRVTCDRPLLCSKCSRELSLEWGQAPALASKPSTGPGSEGV